MCFAKEKEEQRNGRNKHTTINLTYIESGEYRKKFDLITDNKEINRLLYHCAKKILNHRSGTMYEDMYWIDVHTYKIVAKENNQCVEKKILYSNQTKKIVKSKKGLITIHNHPSSFPPSVSDFNSNYQNAYQLGVICGHDGTVFIYTSKSEVSDIYWASKVEFYKSIGYNDYDAQMKTIENLSRTHNIKCKEVSL